jgi:chemosensory pili system protein ChpB (putative protein-glutamate methylesterase)
MSDSRQAPRVGVIADSELSLHLLQSLLLAAGYKVAVTLLSATLEKRIAAQAEENPLADHVIDIWVAELEEQRDNDSVIDLLCACTTAPVLMGDGVPAQTAVEELERWQRRLKEKLKSVVSAGLIRTSREAGGHINPIIQKAQDLANGQRVAQHVWVLGASLGGPEAVKIFLDALPVNLPVAFVYAQHIDDDHDDLLAQVLGRHNSFNLLTCKENHILRDGQVTIVPTDHKVSFLPMGKVQNEHERWQGPFAPCIDQVISDVALQYKQKSGAIIFSGMSDDGSKGATAMSDLGGEIWVQQPESCICSSMPDAVLAKKCVSFSGTPEQLAQALMEKFAKEYMLDNEKSENEHTTASK